MEKELENVFLTGLEENKQKLLRICAVYSKDEDEKKDLFQEALINIWKSMPSFKSNSTISTWMFRVTLNVCLSMQTKLAKAKKRFVAMESIDISQYVGQSTYEDEHPLLAYLRICLKSLDEADKAVMTLYLEELPYKEIGDVTGLTENHVAVKVKRIKKKLLNCINEKS
ncbi:MAG: RNA polymerase sigma factor [Ekhidna sp.]